VSYIVKTKVGVMKKIPKNTKPGSYPSTLRSSKVEEPISLYKSIKSLPLLKDFTYAEFKKIADKAPFNQGEWAAILHLSERTLQRYSKNTGTFAPMNAERALQIARVLEEGKTAFGSTERFYNWLKGNPYMLEGNLSLESLSSQDGINRVLVQLGRIQQGIFA
jgi:putative toxin-antitoxin system antitoxin component (TIGR02293 family)